MWATPAGACFSVACTEQTLTWCLQAAWHLFNPRSHGIHAQVILPASPACVTWFSRHPLNRQNSTEESAPRNPALPSSTVVSSLTSDKSFKTLFAFGVSDPHLPHIRSILTSRLVIGGDLCRIGQLLTCCFCSKLLEVYWRMELSLTLPALKRMVGQVSWPQSRFGASFNSKKWDKLGWEEVSYFFKIWFTLLPILFIAWGSPDSEEISDIRVI